MTGLKAGKAPSSSLGSSDYLHTYLVSESAITAPLDPYYPTTEEQSAMESGFDQYYRMGETVTFSPKTISGYFTPSAKTVTLNEEDNVVTFTYAPFVTSVPFINGTVVDGGLTNTPPPAGAHTPLIAKSLLAISGGASTQSDCSHIMSAGLLAADAVTSADLPSGTTVLGGVDFSLACTSGGQTGIDYALGATVPDIAKLRVFKYDPTTHKVTDIAGQVAISTQTIDGTARTVISYTLTDGGKFDEDNQANGTIKDPLVIGYAGDPAEAASGGTLAETGMNLWAAVALLIMTTAISGAVLVKSVSGRGKA